MHDLKEKYLQHLKDINYADGSCKDAEHHLNRFLSHLQTQGIEKIQNVTKQILIEYYVFVTTTPGGVYTTTNKTNLTGQPQGIAPTTNLTNLTNLTKFLSFSSIYSRFKWIRQFFGYLEKERIVLLNPAEKIPMRARCNVPLPKNIMTKEEILEFFSIAATTPNVGIRDRAILEILYSTGLRRQELVNLNIYDVNFGDGVIFVRQGKGKRDRFVPVGKEALLWLERYLRETRPMLLYRKGTEAQRHKGTKKGFIDYSNNSINCTDRSQTCLYSMNSNPLFLSCYGSRITKGIAGGIVRNYRKKLGIFKKITPHSFRHSFATHLLQSGCNIIYIQAMLGHKSPKTTQIYTKVEIKDLVDVVRKCHPHGKKTGVRGKG